MNLSSTKWIPCIVCCCLLFFAATADFVSTSVVSGGYDANQPPVKIEHKCVSHSMAVGALAKNARTLVVGWLTLERSESFKVKVMDGIAISHHPESAPTLIVPPLRC
jgi:hypothetical protein